MRGDRSRNLDLAHVLDDVRVGQNPGFYFHAGSLTSLGENLDYRRCNFGHDVGFCERQHRGMRRDRRKDQSSGNEKCARRARASVAEKDVARSELIAISTDRAGGSIASA